MGVAVLETLEIADERDDGEHDVVRKSHGSDRLECERVDLHRVAVLFQGEHPPAVPQDVGVRRAAADPTDAGVVGAGVALRAEQGATSGSFREELRSLHVAAPEVDLPVFESEERHHAIAPSLVVAPTVRA